MAFYEQSCSRATGDPTDFNELPSIQALNRSRASTDVQNFPLYPNCIPYMMIIHQQNMVGDFVILSFFLPAFSVKNAARRHDLTIDRAGERNAL